MSVRPAPQSPAQSPDSPRLPEAGPRDDDELRRARLSAALDGDAEALAEACRDFRDDVGARSTWHAYHLIGDVMRSSELAQPARRDADFLASLRERLAAEPVVLAPAPVVAPRRRWSMPAAAAASVAGVAVVAGALVMSRPDAVQEAPGFAAAPGLVPVQQLQQAQTTQPVLQPQARPVARNGMLRDERLDEFLRVHQGMHGGFALPRPESRPVDLEVAPAR